MAPHRLFLTLALASLTMLVACAPPAPPKSAQHDLFGQRIELALPTDQGQLGAVPAQGAAVTVADFFAPTCEPCKKKVPELVAKKAELEAMGAKLVLVAVLADSESTDDARKALSGWGVSGVGFLVDQGDSSKRDAGVRDLPSTLVLDKAGQLRWSAPVTATADDVVIAVKQAQ